MKPEDVRELLAIDKAQLDLELERQPELVYDINMACVDAMSDRDAAVLAVKEAEAEVKREYHRDNEKGTATAANNYAAEHKDVLAAKAKLDKLVTLVRRWEVCTNSISKRGMALHKICDLELTHGAAITGQSEREDRSHRREKADDDVQDAVDKRRRRRRRVVQT